MVLPLFGQLFTENRVGLHYILYLLRPNSKIDKKYLTTT